MIPKLIIILLLAIEHILSENTIVHERRTLSTSPFFIGVTTRRTARSAEERSASFKFANDYSITSLNGSSSQLHQKSRNGDQTQGDYISLPPEDESNSGLHDTVDDLEYHPVVRYETKNNHSQVRGQFALGKNAVEALGQQQKHQQQSSNKTTGKSKGFIEFEFDIDGGIAGRENNDGTIEETNRPASSLKQILSSLFPQGIADIFRFSYVADPPKTRTRLDVQRFKVTKPKENNRSEQIITTQSPLMQPTPESALPQLPHPSPSIAPATVENGNRSNSSIVTNEDVRDINNAAEKVWNRQETKLPTIFPANLNQNYSRLLSPFGEPINAESPSDSDYEDHNLNLDEDNLIAPSRISSNQLFYPHPSEIQIGGEADNTYPQKDHLSGIEKQINVQIIQDTLGGYGQKIISPQTRHLDDFQEEVEKQFNPNDIRTDSEAPSRKFLKNFKEKINNKNQSKAQLRSIQPESLLHTYIYSSDRSNDSITHKFPVDIKSYEAPPAGSPSQVERLILNSPSAYRVSNQNPSTLKGPDFQEIEKDTQAEENREAKAISPLHTDVFHHNANNKIFITRSPQNEIDGLIESTSPYPRYRFKPPTIVEIQKSVNIHNKFITEKNGNLIEQHEIYSRPEQLHNSRGQLYLGELTTQPSLSENPIRVAQAEESLQSESVVHPGIEIHSYQQIQSHQQLMQQEKGNQEPYQIEEQSYQQEPQYDQNSHELPTDQQDYQEQQYTQGVQEQEQQYQHLQKQQEQQEQYEQLQQNEDQKYQQLQEKQQQEQQYQEVYQQQYQDQHDQQVQKQQEQEQQYEQLRQQQEDEQRYEQLKQKEEQEQYHEQQQLKFQQQQERNHNIKQQQKDGLHEQYQFEYAIYDQPQGHRQNQESMYNKEYMTEKPASYPDKGDRLEQHSYPVEKLVKYIDRPVPVEHIVEKQVNVPYPVREVVEKIIDRPVPVEKIIDRPVHIPYPVQVDHFIDRPYPVQVPVAVAVPVPVHRFIDRPYPVEKIIEKPIHVPYPVEKIIEKVVEKHVPVEVERIVEKPIEKIVEKHIDRPVPVKKFVARPVPIHIPVPVGVPVAVTLSKQKDKKKKLSGNKAQDTVEDFFELVPPPLPAADGINSYKTIPENIEFLLVDDYNRPMNFDHQLLQWNHPVKRGIKTRNIKRSPDFGRNLRVEYGFKPPLVPSLEIDDQGLPLTNRKSGD